MFNIVVITIAGIWDKQKQLKNKSQNLLIIHDEKTNKNWNNRVCYDPLL